LARAQKTQAKPARSRASIGAVRSPDTHSAILNAAARVLTNEGYAGFTFDAVARLAGSSKPTLYRWWPNKAALIMEVYEQSSETVLAPKDHGSLEADLNDIMRRLVVWWRDTRAGEAFRGVIAEAQGSSEAQEQLRATFLPRRREILRKAFDRAQARGEITNSADTESALSLLIGMNLMLLMTGELDPEICKPAIHLVVRGLVPVKNITRVQK
jgi:AcrR family transcriptional regulator